MKWETARLGELIDVKHGFAFKGEFFADSGDLVLLTPGNCDEAGGLKLRADKEKFYSGEFPDEYLLHQGDMLIVMTDLVGTAPVLGGAFLIPEDDRYLHNQRLGLVTVTEASRLDKGFLYWLLNSNEYRGQVRGSASGATVRHTSPGRVKNVTVRLPPDLASQREIAERLFAYDNLIDNNRRRIKLLEDSVRLLFDEWFVRLRFPGYEHMRITNGVPEGWSREQLGELADLQLGKMLDQKKNKGDLMPYLANVNVRWGDIDLHELREMRFEDAELDRFGLKYGDIVMCEGGEPGRCAIWKDQLPRMMIQKAIHRIRAHADVSYLYLYRRLREMAQSGQLARLFTGATIKHLPREKLELVTLDVPPARLMGHFAEIVDPFERQIALLESANRYALKARDLLLPRLMSGELTV